MDGTKNLEALKGVMPQNELDEIVSLLSTQFFITVSEVPPRKVGSVATDKRKVDEHRTAVTHSSSSDPSSIASSIAFISPVRVEIALTQDDAKIREIKDFMTTTAQTYLGLLAADLIQRIERTKTSAALMALVGQWHMALRDSKNGNRFAGPYLDQVKAALSANDASPIPG